jgi:hypothetical protein
MRQSVCQSAYQVSKQAGNVPYSFHNPRSGVVHYRRTVPARLRAALGGIKSINRSLHTSTDRLNSREFTAAYTAAQIEVEGILLRAEQTPAQAPALTERDRFGLMREILLANEMYGPADSDLTRQVDDARTAARLLPSTEGQQLLEDVDHEFTLFLLDKVVNHLGLQLTPQQRTGLIAEFEQHNMQMLQTRAQEIQQYNLNSVGGVIERLP